MLVQALLDKAWGQGSSKTPSGLIGEERSVDGQRASWECIGREALESIG